MLYERCLEERDIFQLEFHESYEDCYEDMKTEFLKNHETMKHEMIWSCQALRLCQNIYASRDWLLAYLLI